MSQQENRLASGDTTPGRHRRVTTVEATISPKVGERGEGQGMVQPRVSSGYDPRGFVTPSPVSSSWVTREEMRLDPGVVGPRVRGACVWGRDRVPGPGESVESHSSTVSTGLPY